MKTFGLFLLIFVSLSAGAARNWKRTDLHTLEKAKTLEEYHALRAKYPEIFIQEINEAQFYSAKVETFGWVYIGSTVCDPSDERLTTTTHKSSLCLKDANFPIPLCAGNLSSTPRDEDPCAP